ncbi:hypothetical protein [Acetonema longum]|uniref:Uncharacterized protein n=1 Tax=Acetonema longum DSM 6540 TaxID=1009370 RepID=F7NEA3_9FIRM|nr:hypothetical protein [Acetonema longum]EGO65615.1 hypothetical protein ALO_01829 [Acetonema longum DSM 6540]
MKRTVLVFVLIMLVGVTSTHAKFIPGTDQFTGGKTYSSTYNPGDYEPSVSFTKIISGNIVSYEIRFFNRAVSGEKFTKDPIEIKIDDYPVQTIPITEASSMPIDLEDKDITWNRSKAPTPQNIIDQIKVAKRVALKVYTDKYAPAVIVLSDEALAEWKQVISMEK